MSAEQRAAELGVRLDELLDAGHETEACQIVARAFAERSDAGDVAEAAAIVSALPDRVLAGHPYVLLELARACDAGTRSRLRNRLLERAARLVVADEVRGPFALALHAERIVDLARDSGAEAVENEVALIAPLLQADATGSELVREARARASYALGRVLAWRGDPRSVAAAEDALSTSAGASRQLGRTEWRSQVLQTLGYNVHFYRGEETQAASRLREALALLPVGHARRAAVATFLADVFVRTHRPDLALPVLADLRVEAALTGDQRALGYAAWVAGMLASEQGDAAATLELLAEAERHPGDWFEDPVGTEFLADAALSAERVGEIAAADGYLARTVARADAEGHPDIAWLAAGVINARRGDPDAALAVLSELLDADWLPARDLWTIWLYLALARLRKGDELGAGRDAVRSFEAAAALVGPGRAAATSAELPEVLVRLEGDAVRRLATLAAAAGSEIAAAVQPVSPRIRLFGGLDVRIGTTPVRVPAGRPALLLVLVALERRPLSVDIAIDALWPDVAGDVGRRRLRNVLARIKAGGADLVARHGELLSLAAGTSVDVAEFEAACDLVDRALPRERVVLARAALGLVEGELLPEAAYQPRVIRRRDELEQRTVGLLGIVADAAERAGDADAAVAALGRIADLDPYSPAVMKRAEALLRSAGRSDEADRWADRRWALDAD